MNRSIAFLFYMSVINLALSSSVSRADYGEIKLFQASVSYSVESTVLLNDASRRDKEVSYKVKAALDVHPVWTESNVEFMLKFDLISPQLYSRGKHVSAEYMPMKSIWDSYSHTTFYAHWKHGLIQTAYLDPNELLDIQNFKRSLISLFQFQVVDGEGNETDVSGMCKVTYESASMQVIRKFKTACQSAEWVLEDEEGSEEVEARRVTRYTLSATLDALQEVYAEELLTLGEASKGAGLKARAWLRLARAAAPPASAPPAPALGAVPPALAAAPLAAPPPADLAALLDPPSGAEELEAAVAEAVRAAGTGAGGEGGRLADARAALRLGAALRRPTPAAAAALDALLHDAADPLLLDVVCAALGQAPGAAAHAAAARFLRLRGGDVAERPARAYLQALALTPRAPPPALRAAARLGAAPAPAPALREAALLAAGAAARAAPPADARALRDQLVADLARCKDEECRRVRVLALGNMRRADLADVLLEQAEGAGGAALEALGALAALPAAALAEPARLRRLERLALEPRALELRAAALDLLLRVSARAPFALPRALLALRRESAPAPLRRLAARRLAALAPRRAPLAALLRLLPQELRGWDELAQPGTTSVLEREVAAGGWRARLDSVQLESGGALRRGLVRLRAAGPRAADDVLAVELWTRGLQALVGGAPVDDEPGDDEPASGGLALSVGGARLPGVTLFSNQAELLAHVWAGTASEPTPVLRAVRPLGGARAAVVLLGGAPLLYRRDAALALALDAQAQVSLWSRSARTQLSLRAAAAARGEARAASAWGALAAAAALEAEPRLHIAADLDFYDGVSLCVRVSTTDFRHSYNVTMTSELGAAPRRVRRRRSQTWTTSGRTLALGAPNDATCRALGAGD
ncbi:unnamed protein product, partial [Brenthis ino]